MYRSGAVMAWNVFKFCTALRALGSIMILLVLGVVGVTYYAVVITNYGPALAHGGLDCFIAFAILIFFHCLLVMLLWSYFSVVFTDPGSVPPNWRPLVDEETGDTEPLTTSEFGAFPSDPENRSVRFCRKCNQLKPPRCHHCSACGRCVLKMDHHCVWVVNCVGALNYKYFLLFLNCLANLRIWNKEVWREKRVRAGMDRWQWATDKGISISDYSTESDSVSDEDSVMDEKFDGEWETFKRSQRHWAPSKWKGHRFKR